MRSFMPDFCDISLALFANLHLVLDWMRVHTNALLCAKCVVYGNV